MKIKTPYHIKYPDSKYLHKRKIRKPNLSLLKKLNKKRTGRPVQLVETVEGDIDER